MKTVTFTASGMLAGLANMLEILGFDAEDHDIARGMEAPYLVIHHKGCYKAGAGLYHPQWMNLYLHPRGFHMAETVLQQGNVCSYLREHQPAMLSIDIGKGVKHPVVYAGYASGRYEFVNIKLQTSPEPDYFSLTSAMLKRRLDAEVKILTLEKCEPKEVDFAPLLLNSLDVLDMYLKDLLALHSREVTRAEFSALHNTIFRALMQDMLPMATLIQDLTLATELRLLNHDYRHVFTTNDPESIALYERLPRSSIRQCINWLREDIFDRLYELGVSDEVTDLKRHAPDPKEK